MYQCMKKYFIFNHVLMLNQQGLKRCKNAVSQIQKISHQKNSFQIESPKKIYQGSPNNFNQTSIKMLESLSVLTTRFPKKIFREI